MAYIQVGDQDPELKNSPIAVESDEDFDVLRNEVGEAAVCYFNGESFKNGSIVQSGALALRCELGIWVPLVAGDRDHP